MPNVLVWIIIAENDYTLHKYFSEIYLVNKMVEKPS